VIATRDVLASNGALADDGAKLTAITSLQAAPWGRRTLADHVLIGLGFWNLAVQASWASHQYAIAVLHAGLT